MTFCHYVCMSEASRTASLNDNITAVTRLLMASRGGMNQTELAELLGVHRSFVTKRFDGSRAWRIDDIEAMAKAFDCSPALFFEDPGSLFRSRCFPQDLVAA